MATDKYDRQLRLWGHHGQRLLRQSKVCLLGSAAPGVQALKGLILPACGHIAIWDNAITTQADLGTNFFLLETSIGKPRSQQTLQCLLEMNPDVIGQAVLKSPDELLTSPDINSYTLIISNQQSPELNIQLSKACESINKPVIFVNTYGFYGYVRNQATCHEVYQNKELKKHDLRLAEPFASLVEYVQRFELERLIDNQSLENLDKIVHIPYNAIIISAVLATKSSNVKTVQAKIKEWKELVNSEDVENFEEALKNVYLLGCQKKDVLGGIEAVLEKEQVDKATKDSSSYWILCKALKHYIKRYGDYPQIKEIPDMKSSTKSYVQLKEIYLKQHNRTKQQFVLIIHELFPGYNFDKDLVTTFIENLTNMEVIEMRPFYKELEQPLPFIFENNYPAIYVALRGAALFKSTHKRFANKDDIKELQRCINKIREEKYPDLLPVEPEVVKEIARVQGAELISISAIVGNIVAQEAVKLITHQFTPLNSGYFFDGVSSTGTAVEL